MTNTTARDQVLAAIDDKLSTLKD
ncbi:hypothetical protein ACG92U_06990 [Leuconostoc citreum]